MPAFNFLDSNRKRSLPFLKGTTNQAPSGPTTLLNLPDDTIVDCGFRMAAHTEYDGSIHSVYLAAVRRTGDTFYFDFESDCPGLANSVITFSRTVGAPPGTFYVTLFEDSTGGSGDVSDTSESAACFEPLWSGFMVIGNLNPLELFLSGDGEVLPGDTNTTVEPALVQSLAGGYVTSINLANNDRTRVEAAAGCPEIVWPFPVGLVFVNARCLQGSLYFTAGYNATVTQDTTNNAIVLGAAVGQGAGQPCIEVPLTPTEAASSEDLLSGGPACGQVLRSINGIGGPLLNLIAGPGVTITSLADQNTLVVDISMAGLALCFDSSDTSESV